MAEPVPSQEGSPMAKPASAKRPKTEESPGAEKGYYLLKYMSPEAVAHVGPIDEPSEPGYRGTVAEFVQQHGAERPAVDVQLWNKVRICPKCEKAVAFTLSSCNGCGFVGMSDVAISRSENVLVAFAYGVERSSKFPLKISLRYQDEYFLCYDDILALSPCHLNCIVTAVHIPDWRYLLLAPGRALGLLKSMWEICTKVVEEQFWGNVSWRESALRGAKSGELTLEEFRGCFLAGMNYPPSQYQLHMQFIVPPLMPFDFHKLENGGHFHHGRFFSADYVKEVLSLCLRENLVLPWPSIADTTVEEICAFFDSQGVSYEKLHGDLLKRANSAHRRLAMWEKADFEALARVDTDSGVETVVRLLPDGSEGGPSEIPVNTRAEDKKVLQNYVPKTFYKYFKVPGELAAWP